MTARTADEPVTSAVDDPVARLSQEVVRMARTSHAMRTQVVSMGTGVEWAGFALLVQLVKDGPRRTSDLAEAACVDPSTVSRQVAQLVKSGLVTRTPDPDDGRAALLVATRAGEETFATIRRRRERAFAELVQDWTPAEVAGLADALRRLNDDFQSRREAVTSILTSGSPA